MLRCLDSAVVLSKCILDVLHGGICFPMWCCLCSQFLLSVVLTLRLDSSSTKYYFTITADMTAVVMWPSLHLFSCTLSYWLSICIYPIRYWSSDIPIFIDEEWVIKRLAHWKNFMEKSHTHAALLPRQHWLINSLLCGLKFNCLITFPIFVFSFRLTAKAVAVLLPILGSSWIFGVLAVNAHALVFQYIFAVFNSLQVSNWWKSLWLLNCCWDPVCGSLVMSAHACVYCIFSYVPSSVF